MLGSAKNLKLPQYVQLILDGLRGGAIYALIALGFVTVFNVTGVINFAQGGFVMLGAMLCVSFNDLAAFAPLPPAAATGPLGAALDRPLRPGRRGDGAPDHLSRPPLASADAGSLSRSACTRSCGAGRFSSGARTRTNCPPLPPSNSAIRSCALGRS